MEDAFIIQKDELLPLRKIDYTKDQLFGKSGEALLQYIISKYPNTIPIDALGEKINFFTVKMEAGVTTGSIDILGLGSDGMFTIMEVKLAKNREIRRQILGQGIEYVSAAWKEWDSNKVREELEKQGMFNKFEEEVLEKWVSEQLVESRDVFWEYLDDNSKGGRFRLIFVADKFPDEILSAIEYLNEQCLDLQIIALECNLYTMKGEEVLFIPQLKGITYKTKTARISKFAPFFIHVEGVLKDFLKKNGKDGLENFIADQPKKGWRKALSYPEIPNFEFVWWFKKCEKVEIQLYWHKSKHPRAISFFKEREENLQQILPEINLEDGKNSGKIYREITWSGDENKLTEEMAQQSAREMGNFIIKIRPIVMDFLNKK